MTCSKARALPVLLGPTFGRMRSVVVAVLTSNTGTPYQQVARMMGAEYGSYPALLTAETCLRLPDGSLS